MPQLRLQQLRRWYGHIRDLGVNTILFGPLFESERHGYDTINYRRIDRRLGDMNLFAEVVAELHEHGFRVLLDGVFNHTGRSFFFRHLREHGPTSRYAAWYHIDPTQDSPYGDGFSYHCWHGHFRLPTLNLMHPDVRDYLFETARFYLADIGIDGRQHGVGRYPSSCDASTRRL